MLDDVGVLVVEALGCVAGFCILDALAVVGGDMCVGSIFRFCWEYVLEFVEGFADVVWHGEGDCVVDVVPLQGDADVEFGFPIYSDFVLSLEGGQEVVGVLFGCVLYSKVIDH